MDEEAARKIFENLFGTGFSSGGGGGPGCVAPQPYILIQTLTSTCSLTLTQAPRWGLGYPDSSCNPELSLTPPRLVKHRPVLLRTVLKSMRHVQGRLLLNHRSDPEYPC